MKSSINFNYVIGLLIIFTLLVSASGKAQGTSYYFYVQFSDKNHSPYSLSNPSAYLSQRAINRRAIFNTPIDSTDLPVNPAYIAQIENLGIHVHCASKWMNGVTVKLVDSTKMSLVRTLPFVKFVQYTGLLKGPALVSPAKIQKTKASFNYGTAAPQINQLNGTFLHDQGFRGKGIVIGVIDAGFTNVDINPAFDSLRLQRRLLGTKDIINPSSNIYSEDTHGAMVLSAMTGNLPGQFLGTAPDASFWLIRTEYGPTEYKVETDFWASGIEFADSVGVDIATSSLGYSTFDSIPMSFSYADMNGKVSRASRAATIASKKGIVVLVAAGNEGNQPWHYISSPADADGIISVGAVDSNGNPSHFTSYGPSSDGRVKPEICAMGSRSALIDTNGSTINGNGTSFATPIMAGMMACLLQKYKTLYQSLVISTLLNSVIQTGNLFANPTAQMGYGIPDFSLAESNLAAFASVKQIEKSNLELAYNSALSTLTIQFIDGTHPVNTFVKIYSITGKLIQNKWLTDSSTVIQTTNFTPGIYAVCISENGKTQTKKILIN